MIALIFIIRTIGNTIRSPKNEKMKIQIPLKLSCKLLQTNSAIRISSNTNMYKNLRAIVFILRSIA